MTIIKYNNDIQNYYNFLLLNFFIIKFFVEPLNTLYSIVCYITFVASGSGNKI